MSHAGRESLEAVRTALEWLPVGVLIVAADGTVVLVNAEIERTFGHHRSELIGRHVDRLVRDGWWAQHGRPRNTPVIARQITTTPELIGWRKDGSELPIEIRLSPIPAEDGSFVIASVVDLTGHRRAATKRVPPSAGLSEREQLQQENIYLRKELEALSGAPVIVGPSPAFRRVLEQARHAAGVDSPVLLIGETGTGKSLLASCIHEWSSRSARPMVRVNCASLAGGCVDSELFGSRSSEPEGAAARIGRLELADRSTLFLDDVATVPLGTQEGLIRAFADAQIQPRGSEQRVKVDLRIIASARRSLTDGIAEGTFRDDLYQRLNVLAIHVPPLRERPEDIPPLVWRFVDEFSHSYGRPIDTIGKETMAALQRYGWPGNARELRNVVECAVIAARTRRLHIPLPGGGTLASDHQTLADLQREHIKAALAACGGEIRGEHGAAARLGLTPRALEAKIAKLGL